MKEERRNSSHPERSNDVGVAGAAMTRPLIRPSGRMRGVSLEANQWRGLWLKRCNAIRKPRDSSLRSQVERAPALRDACDLGLQHIPQLFGDALDQRGIFAFHHDSHEVLGTGVADQDASAAVELAHRFRVCLLIARQ